MKNRTFLAGVCLLVLLSACSRSPRFKVEGSITNAKDKILYFELYGINKTEILDSVKLNEEGNFHFKTELPDAPEFYRLRIDKRFIQLGADSSATVVVKSDGKIFGEKYSVNGSRCCEQIKELSALQTRTLTSVDSLSSLYKNKLLNDTTLNNKINEVFSIHRNAAKKVILRIHGLQLLILRYFNACTII